MDGGEKKKKPKETKRDMTQDSQQRNDKKHSENADTSTSVTFDLDV